MARSAKTNLTAAVLSCAAASPALVPAEAGEHGGGVAAKVRCSATANVNIADANGGERVFFSKRKVTIRPGACVRWIWAGQLDHQVRGPGFQSKTRSAPFRYRKRFAKARRTPISIICGIHPSQRMQVAVKR